MALMHSERSVGGDGAELGHDLPGLRPGDLGDVVALGLDAYLPSCYTLEF